MTDKQLALLLRQIAGRIRALGDVVEPLIESGPTETRDDYAGSIARFMNDDPIKQTRPAAVWRILDLAEDIADEAELLNPVGGETAAEDISQ